MRSATKNKTGKESAYLAWLHELPCVVCVGTAAFSRLIAGTHTYGDVARIHERQRSISEAAHVGNRGLSQKCPDREAIPLCKQHHTEGPEAQHKLGKEFWKHHGLDRDEIIAKLNAQYDAQKVTA